MRNINESVCSGSDTSSIAASSGSPPRSNLARYDIGDWAQGVGPPDEEQWSYYSPSEHPRTESFTPDEHNLSSARYSASASSISLHTPAILATNTPANIPARPTRHPRMDNHPASPYSSSGFGYSAPTDPALDFSGLIPMYDTTARYPRYSPHSSASESPPLTYFPNPHHHVQQHHHHPYLPRPQPSTSRSNGGGGGATSTPSDGTTKKSCSHCHVTTTPLRRREPTTNRPLCNACWLYLQLRNRLPPQELIDADNDDAEEEGPQISDADYTGPKCTHCGTRQTSVWRRDKEGLQLCNACGVYERLRGKKRPLSSRRKKGVPRSERGADGRGVRYKPYAGAGVKLPPLNAQLPSATSSEKPNIAGEDTV
ncbi:hypothetical protein FB45DRAFT_843023 [Roridomyces roridus]|uniref:GATA-type domain-containing protein n=1 Tax=Roridomyces roridus TaxID=1738132 RepID=A0AAD7FD44_9AGAR|nr:hypothetical protein FB45DRAFT_843023 [Roridomyces roridus]